VPPAVFKPGVFNAEVLPISVIFNWDRGAAELAPSNMPSPTYVHYEFQLAASSANTFTKFQLLRRPGLPLSSVLRGVVLHLS
jgi:hypothetical protein